MNIDLSSLSPHQKKVFDAFIDTDCDVLIITLYRRVYGKVKPLSSVRSLQQRMAPTFSAINDKIRPARIEPGYLKKTYRLNTKG